jgi:hypothetical protein
VAPKNAKGYTQVRDGVLEHHESMSFAEIAVFHHLLNCAVRTEQRATKLGCEVGFCPNMSGRRLAEDMGKSRDAVHRALRRLEKAEYITRREDGILVHNFNGNQVAVKQAGPDHGRPESRPWVAVKPANPGRKTGQPRPENRPPNRRDVGDEGNVGDDLGEVSDFAPESAPVHWDSAIRNVVIDESWLHAEIDDFQNEAGVQLTRAEYEHESEQLRLKLLEDTRLRACIRKADGKPSAESRFKGLATYTSGWFKRAIRMKAQRLNRSARASPRAEPEYQRPDPDETAKSIAACKRDHERERIKGGRDWYCPDSCGWTQLLPREQWRENRRNVRNG